MGKAALAVAQQLPPYVFRAFAEGAIIYGVWQWPNPIYIAASLAIFIAGMAVHPMVKRP
jgi:hypothetical protein